MSDADLKTALKEALKEWLDDKFATFGKYALTGMSAAVFAAVVYFWLTFHK